MIRHIRGHSSKHMPTRIKMNQSEKSFVISWLLTGSIKCSLMYHKVFIEIKEYQENYRSNFRHMRTYPEYSFPLQFEPRL